MVLVGIVRSFNAPQAARFFRSWYPRKQFQSAFAWGATIFQTATIWPGGRRIDVRAFPRAGRRVCMRWSRPRRAPRFRWCGVKLRFQAAGARTVQRKTVLAGMHYIWREKSVLGSISLDLFAVLLGGAVALLPVYASEILKTGPLGTGFVPLRAGNWRGGDGVAARLPAAGASAGAKMLWCVAGFGVFTILFGLSHNMVLSMIALIFVGATDMVSVVVRGMLIQLATPDEMRGRVNAVDMIFIGASNEFGGFESGVTAAWFGTVAAVVIGGVGAIGVTALWAWMFPQLRNADRLPSVESGQSRRSARLRLVVLAFFSGGGAPRLCRDSRGAIPLRSCRR